MDVPIHLKSTYDLIKRSFPDEIKSKYYLPIMNILGEELSDRNLAEVMSFFVDIDPVLILNDVYRSYTEEVDDILKDEIISLFEKNGYQDWLNE